MAKSHIHKKLVGAYIYVLVVDGVHRYVGKGRRFRVKEHFRVARDANERRARGEKVKVQLVHNKLAKAIRTGSQTGYRILDQGLSDDDAYRLEIAIIASYPLGQLWNVHRGGRGGDADMMRRLWSDPEFRERTIAAAREGRKNPDYIQRARTLAHEKWSDDEYRERWLAQHRSVWDDPVLAAERRALLKKVWADPDLSAKKRALVKSQWTPERKAAMAENRRAAWADPEFKARATASIRASKSKLKDGPQQVLPLLSGKPGKL